MSPDLVEVLHAEPTVVGPVTLPASVHLVLALVLSGTGGPLGAQGLLGGGDLVLQGLLDWNFREGRHCLHEIGWMHLRTIRDQDVAPESKSWYTLSE